MPTWCHPAGGYGVRVRSGVVVDDSVGVGVGHAASQLLPSALLLESGQFALVSPRSVFGLQLG